ncbi:hypothetical protein [Fusibacter sp. JL216-2]|uniref:hypothetical protein n=1 Tax=Fusibacter sp. JL216-2 TaxID=3071453 RepID=UPI003D35377E
MSKTANESGTKYDDIIHLPRHVSRKRPQMPLEDRAAQFSPFAAVIGHEASVKEAARLTEEKRDLDEAEKTVINEQLLKIQSRIEDDTEPEVQVEHFKKDPLKKGGHYITTQGEVKKIDVYVRNILMKDGNSIEIDDILRIEIL